MERPWKVVSKPLPWFLKLATSLSFPIDIALIENTALIGTLSTRIFTTGERLKSDGINARWEDRC
jgi:hypothetical protein